MATTDFSVAEGFLDGCRVLVLRGELDLETAPTLETTINDCTDGMPIVIDLTDLLYIDSSGLHTLIRQHEHGRVAAIVRGTDTNIARVLDAVQVEKVLPIYDTLQPAVDSTQLRLRMRTRAV